MDNKMSLLQLVESKNFDSEEVKTLLLRKIHELPTTKKNHDAVV